MFASFYFEIAAVVCVVSSVSSHLFRITGWFGANVTLCRSVGDGRRDKCPHVPQLLVSAGDGDGDVSSVER